MSARNRNIIPRNQWSPNDVLHLLNLWEESMSDIDPEKLQRNSIVYNRITVRLQEILQREFAYSKRDVLAKIDTLKRQYSKHKKNLKSGSSPPSWQYFYRVQKIIDQSHAHASDSSLRRSSDAGAGDSGGSLNYKIIGVTETRGIVSFGSAAGCQAGYPDVYTRVSHYLSWIKSHTGVTY